MRQSSAITPWRRRAPARRATLARLLLAALVVAPGTGLCAELIVAAAASLREPVEEIAARYQARSDTTVRLSFGASSALAVQIRLGAPIDVFLSADTRLVDDLEARGLVDPDQRFVFAGNRLVVIQRPGAALAIERAGDLLQPGVRRIALPAEAVPVGRYAREWLASHRLLEPIAPRLVITEHARATLTAVEQGHADLGIVYATDARVARRATLAYRIPDEEQPAISYAAAAVERTPHPAETSALLALLREEDAAELLRAAGFTAPGRPAPDETR